MVSTLAWGTGRFFIEFKAGPFEIRFSRPPLRKSTSKSMTEKLHVAFSNKFDAQYNGLLVLLSQKVADGV